MNFCECNSGSYRWRDIARINGEYFKVDEPTVLLKDGTFDIDPIYDKLAEEHNVDRDDIELETFLNEGFKIYFKTEIASEIVFSKASRPYLSTSALFFSPWVRQPAPPIHPPTHAIPSIKFA